MVEYLPSMYKAQGVTFSTAKKNLTHTHTQAVFLDKKKKKVCTRKSDLLPFNMNTVNYHQPNPQWMSLV